MCVADSPTYRLDAVLGLFNKFVSAEERRLSASIDAKGGYAKVRQDDEALKALIALDNAARAQNNNSSGAQEEDAPRDVLREKTARNKITLALDELKVELREDVADALEKNLDAFTGKFELQVDLLQVALEKYIRAENDRVIGAVTDAIKQGPHMKIKDLVSTAHCMRIQRAYGKYRNFGRYGRIWCVPVL